MSDNLVRVPARSLKEQFSRGCEAWKEQSDPIFRFWTEVRRQSGLFEPSFMHVRGVSVHELPAR
jgi:hypothetical protein